MSLVKISFNMPKVAKRVKEHRAELELFLAAQIQTNRGLLFDREGAHNGHKKWAPLKLRTGQILSKRGTLRKSLAPLLPSGKPGPSGIVRFTGGLVEVGTLLAYAAMMNWGTSKLPGGKLVPKRAKALKIPLEGGGFMFRKSVVIPERRYDEWSKQDDDEVNTALANKMLEVAFE